MTWHRDTVKDKKRREVGVIEDPLESYQGKWVNVYFHKDGRTCKGNVVVDSEKEALDVAKTWFLSRRDDYRYKEFPFGDQVSIYPFPGSIDVFDITHAIQIPCK